jgi:hypothetical protein
VPWRDVTRWWVISHWKTFVLFLQFSAIVNAAVNTHVQVLGGMSVHSLGWTCWSHDSSNSMLNPFCASVLNLLRNCACLIQSTFNILQGAPFRRYCKRCSNCSSWKAWTPYSGPWISQKQEKKLVIFPPLCICLCSEPFSLQSPWILAKTDDNIFKTKTVNLPQDGPLGQLTNPDNKSRTSPRIRTEIVVNQTTPVTELFYYAHLCPLPLVLLST